MRCKLVCRFSILFFLLTIIIQPEAFACHKKHHDCQTDIGKPDVRELPFRIAQKKNLITSAYPEIVNNSDHDRLHEIVTRETLLAVSSVLELPKLVKENPDIRIIAVLQSAPTLFIAIPPPQDKSQLSPAPPRKPSELSDQNLSSLRGKKIGVASGVSTESYVAAALIKAGLKHQQYSLVAIDGSSDRLDAISKGSLDGAVVSAAGAFEAQKRGFRLVSLSNYLGRGMQTVVVGSSRDSLRTEREGVVKILAGVSRAILWLYEPRNREEVISLIRKDYDVEESFAAFLYESHITKLQTFSADLSPTQEMLEVTNGWLSQAGTRLNSELLDMTFTDGTKRPGK